MKKMKNFMKRFMIVCFMTMGFFLPDIRIGEFMFVSSLYANEITPTTNPQSFESVKNSPAKKHKLTLEIWVLDRLHKNHYEVYRNKNNYDKGIRDRSVWTDGRLKQKFSN